MALIILIDTLKTPLINFFPSLENVKAAASNLKGVASITPLSQNVQNSKKFG
mgnify:CR=1 FL=1